MTRTTRTTLSILIGLVATAGTGAATRIPDAPVDDWKYLFAGIFAAVVFTALVWSVPGRPAGTGYVGIALREADRYVLVVRDNHGHELHRGDPFGGKPTWPGFGETRAALRALGCKPVSRPRVHDGAGCGCIEYDVVPAAVGEPVPDTLPQPYPTREKVAARES